MQWETWNEPGGELTAQERLAADLAFKLGMNDFLAHADGVAQLAELPDEAVYAVLKLVALFDHWQELTQIYAKQTRIQVRVVPTAASFDPAPYFHESNSLPPPKSNRREQVDVVRRKPNGYESKSANSNGSHR